MSQTLLVTDQNVRVLLGDTGEAGYGITSERLRPIIRSVVRRWAMWLGVEEEWDLAAFVVDSGNDAAEANTVEFNRILGLRNATTKRLMERKTAEQFYALRDGSDENSNLGNPRAYFHSEIDGITQLYVYPTAQQSTNIDALVSKPVPETLTDATSYDFSKHAMTGIEAQAAAEAASIMTPANRNRLGITDGAIANWRAVAAEVMAGEKTRLGRMRDASHIPAAVN